jgi:hypothetical protein
MNVFMGVTGGTAFGDHFFDTSQLCIVGGN